jgi:DNA-binding MarR family transcriptional regulator/GNAT superfamily N-acetyltransferase
MQSAVAEIRRFNRFYTGRIGLLEEHLSASNFTLAEARVLYELARQSAETAADLTRVLAMDKAHASRILARLKASGLVQTAVNPNHAKQRLLSLTDAGRAAFARLEQGTLAQMESLIAPLDAAQRTRLTEAMRDVMNLLAPARPSNDNRHTAKTTLRDLRPGDLGWVVHRQSILYFREYGFDWTFEALVADIVGRYAANHDPQHEAAGIAERDGMVVGSVFLVKGDAPEAGKLRLLYVEPSARGLGVGAQLVAACIARARALGYRQLTLWTNNILVAARRIYEAAGFRLMQQEQHHSFGQDLVGQYWALDL